jgi:competence protein ComGC
MENPPPPVPPTQPSAPIPPAPNAKTSAMAVWSLVLGILSLTCLSILGAIPAIILGKKASKEIDNSNGSIKGAGMAKAGFIMGCISLAFTVIFGLLAVIAIPNFVKARETAQKNACINNLRQIDGAIQQFALAEKKGTDAAVSFYDIQRYMISEVYCPAGGTSFRDSYSITTVSALPTCISHGGGEEHGHVLPP